MKFLNCNKLYLTLAVVAIATTAKSATLPIGFSYGEIAEQGLSKVGHATVSGAVIIPHDVLSQYEGAIISGIRIGLVTADGVNNLRGWIRNGLDSENLDEASIADATAGWNEASFTKALTLDGTQIVAGFSFEQEKSVKCISVVGENNDDARWIAKNDKWELAKNYGALSIELIISGDNVPGKDLAIISASPKVNPVKAGEKIRLTVNVRNLALEKIDGFDISYDIEGATIISNHYDIPLDYGDKTDVPLIIPTDYMEPDKAYSVSISAICDGDDMLANNRASTKIGIYSKSWPRRVLIEEFTTEQCPNCPRAINTLKQCEEAGYADRMIIVAHHVGYNTDWLTVREDEAYLWFYDPKGIDGTFAPAAMLDRTVLNGNNVPVNSVGYFNDFEPLLKEAIDMPAFARLNMSTYFEDDDNLNIAIDIERLPILETESNIPRLTAYVIEDGILHHAQAGINSDTFTHSHVNRKCLTDIWGDPIEWNGDKAHCELSVALEDGWNKDNLSIVAFVNDYDADDVSKCKVHNSAIAHVGSSGVDYISASPKVVDVDYTTISGVKATENTKGLLIKTETLSDGTQRISKIIRR